MLITMPAWGCREDMKELPRSFKRGSPSPPYQVRGRLNPLPSRERNFLFPPLVGGMKGRGRSNKLIDAQFSSWQYNIRKILSINLLKHLTLGPTNRTNPRGFLFRGKSTNRTYIVGIILL